MPEADTTESGQTYFIEPKRSLVGFLLFLSSDCQLSCAGLPVRSICCLKGVLLQCGTRHVSQWVR